MSVGRPFSQASSKVKLNYCCCVLENASNFVLARLQPKNGEYLWRLQIGRPCQFCQGLLASFSCPFATSFLCCFATSFSTFWRFLWTGFRSNCIRQKREYSRNADWIEIFWPGENCTSSQSTCVRDDSLLLSFVCSSFDSGQCVACLNPVQRHFENAIGRHFLNNRTPLGYSQAGTAQWLA